MTDTFAPQAPLPSVEEMAKQTLFKPSQRQQVEESIAGLESMLHGASELDTVYGIDLDRTVMVESLKREQQMLASGTPPDYTPEQKNRLFKVMRVLEHEFKQDMLTEDQMRRPSASNIDRLYAWERLHKSRVKAWKYIRRVLDPQNDNPNFNNIASLRTNTPPKGDPRKYWQGYDHINWEEGIEDNFADLFTDAEYLQFLQFRAMNWSADTICREIDWTKRQYAAAMERFRQSAQRYQQDVPLEPEEVEGMTDKADDMAALEKPSLVPTPGADAQAFAAWLIDALKARNITQMDFAQTIGMPYPTFRSRINGGIRWRKKDIEAIKTALAAWDGKADLVTAVAQQAQSHSG